MIIILAMEDTPNARKRVASLEDASRVLRRHVMHVDHRTGNGGASHCLAHFGDVLDGDGKMVAHVSYKGRVWGPGGYKPGAVPLMEAAR